MSCPPEPFTVGVEEEYQIIDPNTRALCPRSQQILFLTQDCFGEAGVQLEFRQSQIEGATPVCHSLAEVRRHLTAQRRRLIAAARVVDCQLVAAGTHPFAPWQEQSLTPKPCYRKLVQRYQGLMDELVTFGCHVHIGICDRNQTIQVMNRVRGWLAPLLALSASSPFWLGHDTQYASYRSVLIRRLPISGAPPAFTCYRDYQTRVQSLLTTQMIDTSSQVCWDLRPSEQFPTLEFRIADMPLTIDETVMIAGLVRSLVRTCHDQIRNQIPEPMVQSEILAAAQWQAARWGLKNDLMDVHTAQTLPAHQLIEKLLAFVRPALEDWGEWEEVVGLCQHSLSQGTGADRQRRVFKQTGSLINVVDYLVAETEKGCASTSSQSVIQKSSLTSNS